MQSRNPTQYVVLHLISKPCSSACIFLDVEVLILKLITELYYVRLTYPLHVKFMWLPSNAFNALLGAQYVDLMSLTFDLSTVQVLGFLYFYGCNVQWCGSGLVVLHGQSRDRQNLVLVLQAWSVFMVSIIYHLLDFCICEKWGIAQLTVFTYLCSLLLS